MRSMVQERARAIALRKQGYSYSDILKEVPVSKSSISIWLQDLKLTDQEKKSLKNRRESNISLGRIRAGAVLRQNRLERERLLFLTAKEEFKTWADDPFFHVGIALYWAEGAKRNSAFMFVNSDSEMMALMVLWIESFLKIDRKTLKYRLFIHKPYAHENCEAWWAGELKVPLSSFQKTIYKPTGLLVKKRPNYKGCLRIEMSLKYLRIMQFWQNLLIGHHGKQS